MADVPHEQYKPQEAPRASQQLAWQPSAADYHLFGTSVVDQRTQASNDLIGGGVLTNLQFDFGDTPLLAQAEASRQQGYAAKTPNLDAIDPLQLSHDAQVGGAAGNWDRHLDLDNTLVKTFTIKSGPQPEKPTYLDFGSPSALYRSECYRLKDDNERTLMAEHKSEQKTNLPTDEEMKSINKGFEYFDIAVGNPANRGLELGGELNSKTGEGYLGTPYKDHVLLRMVPGTTDIFMTHLQAILNNPGFRNSLTNLKENDYDNAIKHKVRMWSSNKDGNRFMFDPIGQHVYEWKKGNLSNVPDLDLGYRAANAIFPEKYNPPKRITA